ncbi:hypothetical protein [Roseospira visakhapatnamensis]|uniref:Uncharacterized protein n=1 Tax=Roseospira visakhapatnamensis TaxID=390880 RepID=A0A7W6RHR9_9PROT|nr:hypothetical protein [Roseospira visakhapatnamensis]MBB4268259.1 hypothetical protein [Roseospira visakhapatnamensis]
MDDMPLLGKIMLCFWSDECGPSLWMSGAMLFGLFAVIGLGGVAASVFQDKRYMLLALIPAIILVAIFFGRVLIDVS